MTSGLGWKYERRNAQKDCSKDRMYRKEREVILSKRVWIVKGGQIVEGCRTQGFKAVYIPQEADIEYLASISDEFSVRTLVADGDWLTPIPDPSPSYKTVFPRKRARIG